MDKIESIQKHLREEIERAQKNLEENARCKCYANAANLEVKIETLKWCWNLIAAYRNYK